MLKKSNDQQFDPYRENESMDIKIINKNLD